MGLAVLGTVNDLADLVDEREIDQVIVAEGGERMARKVLDACLYNNARLRIVPELGTVLAGGPTTRDIRDLEITDLLPRPAVSTELDAVAALVRGSRVLVTGAGGSIGSEIVSQVLEFEARRDRRPRPRRDPSLRGQPGMDPEDRAETHRGSVRHP